jgi:hypothetical protein
MAPSTFWVRKSDIDSLKFQRVDADTIVSKQDFFQCRGDETPSSQKSQRLLKNVFMKGNLNETQSCLGD